MMRYPGETGTRPHLHFIATAARNHSRRAFFPILQGLTFRPEARTTGGPCLFSRFSSRSQRLCGGNVLSQLCKSQISLFFFHPHSTIFAGRSPTQTHITAIAAIPPEKSSATSHPDAPRPGTNG